MKVILGLVAEKSVSRIFNVQMWTDSNTEKNGTLRDRSSILSQDEVQE